MLHYKTLSQFVKSSNKTNLQSSSTVLSSKKANDVLINGNGSGGRESLEKDRPWEKRTCFG